MARNDITSLAQELQRLLAQDDRADRYRPPTLEEIEQMRGVSAAVICRIENLKLKMYQEPGHALPHLHIDYGKDHHVASYGIDPAVRLAGSLSHRYDRTVINWIQTHSTALTEFWGSMQLGQSNELLLAELRDGA